MRNIFELKKFIFVFLNQAVATITDGRNVSVNGARNVCRIAYDGAPVMQFRYVRAYTAFPVGEMHFSCCNEQSMKIIKNKYNIISHINNMILYYFKK